MIIKYTEMIRGKISRQDRSKLVSLVTIEVHARDILDKLQATKTESINDFLWTSQLRFYWDTVEDTCMIRQNHALIKYDYEYVGNSGRLVITPLTDRCYMTLTTALQLYRGGLPQVRACPGGGFENALDTMRGFGHGGAAGPGPCMRPPPAPPGF